MQAYNTCCENLNPIGVTAQSLGEDAAVPGQPAECTEGLPWAPRHRRSALEKARLQPGSPGLAHMAAVKFRRREKWSLAAG